MKIIWLSVLLAFLLQSVAGEDNPIVETEYGRVLGILNKGDRKDYYSFQGIPYASPPDGYYRFRVSTKKFINKVSKYKIAIDKKLRLVADKLLHEL